MDENQIIDHDRIMEINIEEEMKSPYINYSMPVIVARALPDIRDGFKPVHHRILYGTLGISNTSDRPYKKYARVVDKIPGKYHPHGDSSVYGALARLIQDRNMRYTLVDGRGSSGSVGGDSATIMRYTERRLSKMGKHAMDDLDRDTVGTANDFDNTLQKLTAIPTRTSNLFVDGRNGITVGITTNIPAHNLREVIGGCCACIDNPEIELDELMKHIQAPDFPTGAYIYRLQGVKGAYETDHGRITTRTKVEIESDESHDRIVVTEIPYGANEQQFVEYIAAFTKEGKLGSTSNVSDESGQQGVRIVIDVKRGVNANVILNKLFKVTTLQGSFSIDNIALVKGRPRLLSLRGCAKYFVEHRHDVIIRRTKFKLKKTQEHAYILEGLIIIYDNIDEVVHIIRGSKAPSEVRTSLEKRFDLDNPQSRAIVDIRLSQLAGLRIDQLYAEYDELEKLIAYLENILSDPELCKKVMKDKLGEAKGGYGDGHRTKVTPDEHGFNTEDSYLNDPVVITISHLGYIKRMPLSDFRGQVRGDIGSKGAIHHDQDFTEFICPAITYQTMLLFTEKGRCCWLKYRNIPEGAEDPKGHAIQNLLNIDSDDATNAILRLCGLNDEEFINSHYVALATKNGTMKKTSPETCSRPRTNGVIAINIAEGDEVVDVRLTSGEDEFIVTNRSGRAMCFDENTVRTMGRTTTGVRGMRLDDGDNTVAGAIAANDLVNETVMVVSENGHDKCSLVEDYRKTNRGGKGIKTLSTTDKAEHLVTTRNVTDDNDLMIINKSGIIIRLAVSECCVTGHATQSVRLINLSRKDDVAVSICKTMNSKLEASSEKDNKEKLDQPDREGEDTVNSGTNKSTTGEAPLVDLDDELESDE